MKPLSYSTNGHYNPATRGKGFPRHLYKKIDLALDEDEAISLSYGYTGNRYLGEPTRTGMNRSYANLSEWKHDNLPFVKWNHAKRWLHTHIGEDVDQVFKEFAEAWNAQPALKSSCRSARSDFEKFIWASEGKFIRNHPSYCDNPRYYPFLVDKQNRLQVNPDFRNYKQKPPVYDSMFVRDNRPVLDEVQNKLNKDHGNGFWLHGGDAVGPIGIPKQLWVLHPATKQPVKAPVSLVRTAALEEKKKDKPYGDREIGLTQKLSDSRLEWLKREFQPVSVIWDKNTTKRGLRVECRKFSTSYYTDYMEWTFVIPKTYFQ